MVKISKSECCGCSVCANICPNSCIQMLEDDEGFCYPNINNELCINCGLCKEICPTIEERFIYKDNLKFPKAYAAFTKDDNIRYESSSGGIFSELAIQFLSNGGEIYGVAFNDDFDVEHICVSKKDELKKLRGAKYLQSDIGRTYFDVRKKLESGKQVYFSGTPCQVEGLYAFLKKDYNNLFTQDVICHGVPSKKLWHKYLFEIKEIKKVNFRDKIFGWKNYLIRIETNSKQILQSRKKNPIMKAYLSNISLRPSCYNCKFKKEHRMSDVTLADLWGADKLAPEMDDNKGLSLVIVHSNKGMKLLDNIYNNIKLKEIDINKAIIYNPSMVQSASKPLNREPFFKNINTMNVKELVSYYCRQSFFTKVINKIKFWLVHI